MRATIGTFVLILGILALSFLPRNEAISIKSTPNKRVIDWSLKKHNDLLEEADQFKKSLTKDTADLTRIRHSFHELKRSFKGLEFLYYYLDPQTFNMNINGAPLPKLKKKVPDLTILEPQGFQRLEELIYEDELTKEFHEQLDRLILHLSGYETLFNREYMTDAVIFESIRYGIIRLNTMSITGFDYPGNPDISLKDAAMLLRSIQEIQSHYADYISKNQYKTINKLCAEGIKTLEIAEFENFNRFVFIQDVLDPLWKSTLELQRSLQIELPNQRFTKLKRPVNYEAKSLYASDFLDVNYFSEFAGKYKESKELLGEKLFFDKRLSKNISHNCASCHNPKLDFTDGLPLSKDLTNGGSGKRNSPSLINAVYAERFFHDMRVDRLAFQMDHVVLNPIEFNIRYDTIIDRLDKDEQLKAEFLAIYGDEGISKNTITNAMSNYIASLTSFNSEFDQAIRNPKANPNQLMVDGFNLFMGKATCATCHFPPTFSGLLPPEYAENESEVLGVPSTPEAPFEIDQDLGRYMNHILKEQAPFYKHAFKTPTARNTDNTAPYMHNGVYTSLEEVIDFYNVGGGIGLGIDVPNQTLPPDSLHLSNHEKKALIRFLEALNDNPFVESTQ